MGHIMSELANVTLALPGTSVLQWIKEKQPHFDKKVQLTTQF